MLKVKRLVSGLVFAATVAVGVAGVAGSPASVSAAGSCTVTSTLKVGARGEQVRCLEQALAERGLLRAKYVDTYLGTTSRTAIKAVERQMGRRVSARKGVADTQVIAYLKLAPLASGGAASPVTTPVAPVAPALPTSSAVTVPALPAVEQLAVSTLGQARWSAVSPMVRLSIGVVGSSCGGRACSGETTMMPAGVPSVVVVAAGSSGGLLAHEIAHAVIFYLTADGRVFAAQQAAYAGSPGLTESQVDELAADRLAGRWLGGSVAAGSYAYGTKAATPAIVALVDAVVRITG